MNVSARYGASSLYTSFKTSFAIPSGPGAFPLGSFFSSLSSSVFGISWAGSYILTSNASNTVEFDMPAYPGLHPGFPVASYTF